MSAKPVRITRSRVKGSKLESPNGLPVVCVTRGTRWGNPHKLETPNRPFNHANRLRAVTLFRFSLAEGKLPYTVEDIKRELRGKNLACWCKEGPCHADVLLEVANG